MTERTTLTGLVFVGLDPGATGGIAVIVDGERSVATLGFGSATEAEIADFLRPYASRIQSCVIEKVWGRPDDSPTTAGVLVGSYKFLRGVMTALYIPFTEATPQKWQAKLGVPGDDKPALRQYMQQRYPGVRWTNQTSAAGCLAVYASILHRRNGVPPRDEPEAGVILAEHCDGEEVSAATKELRAFNEISGGKP